MIPGAVSSPLIQGRGREVLGREDMGVGQVRGPGTGALQDAVGSEGGRSGRGPLGRWL